MARSKTSSGYSASPRRRDDVDPGVFSDGRVGDGEQRKFGWKFGAKEVKNLENSVNVTQELLRGVVPVAMSNSREGKRMFPYSIACREGMGPKIVWDKMGNDWEVEHRDSSCSEIFNFASKVSSIILVL